MSQQFSGRRRRRGGAFSPGELFANGEQGAWYDPSDFSTLYQDSAGTTPVTALGQPVGLMLDKSQGGKPTGPEQVVNPNSENGPITFPSDLLTRFSSKTQSTDFVREGTYSTKLTATAGSGTHYWKVEDIPANVSIFVSGWAYIPSGATAGQNLKAVDVSDGSFIEEIVPATATDAWVYFSFIRVAKGVTYVLSLGQNVSADWGTNSIYFDNISVREIPGNHAAQATAAARPTVQARKNVIDGGSDDLGTSWSGSNLSRTTGITAPDGTATAARLEVTGTGAPGIFWLDTSSFVSSQQHTFSIWVRVESSAGSVRLYNMSSTSVTTINATSTWQRFSVTQASPNGFVGLNFAGVSIGDKFDVWGAQLEQGSTATTYQRVTTATDYADIGLPRYLEFDGVDDAMATQSVDFSASDEMSSCAGISEVYPVSGVGQNIFEFSASSTSVNGSFSLWVDASSVDAGLQKAAFSRGTARGTAVITENTSRFVLASVAKVSADSVVLRQDGAVVATDTVNQGTGNYGDYPLYIAARNQASNFLKGRIHQLIIRGATTAGALLDQTERFVARKTGVTL